MPFPFVVFFWDVYDSNLTLSQRSLRLFSFLLICFSFFLSVSFISTILSYTSLILSSASTILLFIPSRVRFISFIALFIIYWLFNFFLVLVKPFLHLLNPVSRLFICNSILFSRFWIIFAIIIWNSLLGRFPISSSFVWFSGHLSCSFTCWVFLCLFILLYCCVRGGLSVFWQFVQFSLLWSFLPVSGVGRVTFQGFLIRETRISVLVGGAGFILSGVQWSVQ